MTAFDRAWAVVKWRNFNPADEEWFELGGESGTHTEIDEDGNEITYFSGNACPSCGGTEGYYEDYWYGGDEPIPTTFHWCSYTVDREQICGDCNSPINFENPSLDSGLFPLDDEDEEDRLSVMSQLRGAKGLGDKRTHQGNQNLGCKRCYDEFAGGGLLPHNIEMEMMGIDFDPETMWRYQPPKEDGT